ncbi:MAG: RNA polymerase sigma factor [Alphaproteobacteria bacterium]|nr:RNA polymerase sigma factor [Alphaproteobacteria bacterium]MCD8570560.1 RNA polymerase sigma factor [Alphaproteobacteria bacterium]
MTSESSSPPTWESLAVQAQGGDKKAYHKLLSEIFPYVRNYLMGGLSNAEWAEDIAQDVLLSVHKSLHTYSAGKSFKPWLMAITQFRRADYLRKHYSTRQNMQTDLDDHNFQATHVTNPAHAGELKDMEAALGKLPEKQRRLFMLVRVEGYSIEEAAKEMDMSVSAVKVSLHRTLKKLREDIELS